MRLILFTTLYPSRAAPTHGVFVENRLRAFLRQHDADVRVVSPIPWFPFSHHAFGQYAVFAKTPRHESRFGVDIWRPQYFIPPKISMRIAPRALAHVLRKTLDRFDAEGWRPDFIDAHYLYPDGVAAATVAAERSIPLALTARGTDVSLIPNHRGPRKDILRAVAQADCMITVADALKDRLASLGAPAEKIQTLRNGVDLELFRPLEREAIRERLKLKGPVLASVGHLIERKGHHLIVDALAAIPEATLLIVGSGPLRNQLELRVRRLGFSERVRFLGNIAHEKLPEIYNACDALVLASSREGWPNVLLEAMACGTPCVATNVWGNAEVISSTSAGALAEERSADAIAAAVNKTLGDRTDRDAVRAHAEAHSWEETADRLFVLFSSLKEKSTLTKSVTRTPITRLGPAKKPRLIVTVDTEEVFDWTTFEKGAHVVAPTEDIEEFQSLCESLDASPLYFLSYPLIANSETTAFFRAKVARKKAHAGLHMHPWVTPPFFGRTGEYFSYQKNYPPAQHREKLTMLSEAFTTAFGERPMAHRAGRYGVAPENYALLAQAGLRFDFSPAPAFDYSATGGSDFSNSSNRAFIANTYAGDVTVTPVCGARAWRHTNLFLSQEKPYATSVQRHRRDSFTEAVRLTPEGSDLRTLQALTKRLVADQIPILTFTLHSTSLTIGANAYSTTAADVEKTLTMTGNYLDWFKKDIGGDVISFDQLRKLYALADA